MITKNLIPLCLFVILGSQSTLASQPRSVTIHKRIETSMLSGPSDGPSDGPPEATPIRQASGHVIIKKRTAVTQPNGYITYQTSDVCSAHINVPVFDLRPNQNQLLKMGGVNCQSTVGGNPVNVGVGASVALVRDLYSMMTGDLKSFSASSYIAFLPNRNQQVPPDPAQILPELPEASATFRDLTQKEVILASAPDLMTVCNSGEVVPAPMPIPKPKIPKIQDPLNPPSQVTCTASIPESFVMTFEILDDQQ